MPGAPRGWGDRAVQKRDEARRRCRFNTKIKTKSCLFSKCRFRDFRSTPVLFGAVVGENNGPQICPCPNRWAWEYIRLYRKEKWNADELRLLIHCFNRERMLNLTNGTTGCTKGDEGAREDSQREVWLWEKGRDMAHMALKTGRGHQPRNSGGIKELRRKENGFYPGASRKERGPRNCDFNPGRAISGFWPPER